MTSAGLTVVPFLVLILAGFLVSSGVSLKWPSYAEPPNCTPYAGISPLHGNTLPGWEDDPAIVAECKGRSGACELFPKLKLPIQ